MATAAIVPAAGKGSRMGADKALLRLGGSTAIERLAAATRAAGLAPLFVVRAASAAPLPPLPGDVRVLTVSGEGDMADSLRAALAALPADCDRVVVCPVDHALVEAETFAAVAARAPEHGIARPVWRGRPGHPVALARAVFAELEAPGVVLRDVVRRDQGRVRDVPSANRWTVADLDRPDDLRAARAAVAAEPFSVVEQMLRHRSHRAYADAPIGDEQLERLVDAARHASTSSFIQAYAVVAVRDPQRRAAVARLCGGQAHVAGAPLFVAVCADLHKLAVACARHGQRIQTQSFELFLQASVDAALLGQNLALAAESEGLGVCMIGAARNHPLELAALLDLPPHVFVLFGMTIGQPADDPVPRGRMPLPGILFHERYVPAQADEALAGADEGMRAWARRTNAERGGYQGRPVDPEKGWTERMARLWGQDSSYVKARASLVDELRRLGFGLE